MHVLLRRRQVLMARQFLNRFGRRSSHRQMRTECVPQDVDGGLYVRPSSDSPHGNLNLLLSQRLPFSVAHNSTTLYAARLAQRL